MTPHIIATTNRKGGVGKTTLTVHLAAGLAMRGWRVLVVDCDPQGQCATLLGVEKADGLYDLLVNDAHPDDALYAVETTHTAPDSVGSWRVWLLPSGKQTAFIAYERGDLPLLADALARLDAAYGFDIILLDTPPSANVFDAAIYYAADAMVFVTEASALSLDGLREGLNDFEEFNAQRAEAGKAPLRLLGIQPNRVQMGAGIQRRNLNRLDKLREFVWQPVRQRVAWQEAAARGMTVFRHAPDSPAAGEAWGAVDALERALASWEAT